MNNKNLIALAMIVIGVAFWTSPMVDVLGESITNRGFKEKSENYIGFENQELNLDEYNNAEDIQLYSSEVDGDVQKVKTDHSLYSYPNIVVQKGIPVEWTISADENSVRSCNIYMYSSEFQINNIIENGNNIINFIPKDEGTFSYSCSMGMYYGTITVVNDINNFDENLIKNQIIGTIPLGGSSNCCIR